MSSKGFQPRWSEQPPRPGSYRSIFKWGAPDGFKHPNRRMFALLKKELGLRDDHFRQKRHEGHDPVVCSRPVQMEARHIRALTAIVGESNVSTRDYDRVKYASGKTMEEILTLRRGQAEKVADLIVHPRHKQDVGAIVAYCHDHEIPVHVHGGGSSVTLGLRPPRGGVTLVMATHMNRILNLNETNQTITVEPGLSGLAYEAALNQAPERLKAARRYTGGHFPQSFEFSSVGGWIVTLGSGQASSYYGDMYDLVLSQEYVTPTGQFKTLDFPAAATGPKVNDIMKGSEGAFGVLVAATLKVFRHQPRNRRRYAFIFPDWPSAVEACRQIAQGEFGMPAVFRISDPEETAVALKLYGVEAAWFDRILSGMGYKAGRRCLCIGTAEGQKSFARNIKKQVRKICRQHKALSISGFPVRAWEHGRYRDPYLREDLNDYGIVIDTLETSVTWDNLHQVHGLVREYIKARPHTLCMTHASHFYPQGTNLYFIFITAMDDPRTYKKFQSGIIDAIERAGGSLSHHHGVGKMISPWMQRHLGPVQMNILRALKRHFDPHNIMNPGGTLGLDGS
jgi:alkyldihydroxyacetonephosphate synthase